MEGRERGEGRPQQPIKTQTTPNALKSKKINSKFKQRVQKKAARVRARAPPRADAPRRAPRRRRAGRRRLDRRGVRRRRDAQDARPFGRRRLCAFFSNATCCVVLCCCVLAGWGGVGAEERAHAGLLAASARWPNTTTTLHQQTPIHDNVKTQHNQQSPSQPTQHNQNNGSIKSTHNQLQQNQSINQTINHNQTTATRARPTTCRTSARRRCSWWRATTPSWGERLWRRGCFVFGRGG